MYTSTDYDYLFKVLILGDSQVGKSALLSRFCDETYLENHISTIGMDLRIQHHLFNGKTSKVQIWDTAGQERKNNSFNQPIGFRTICSTYYRGANAILLCFDLTNEESFNNIPYWKQQIEKFANENVFIALVGTKSDSKDRQVDTEKIISLANEYSIQYFETSSKKNDHVSETFCQVFNRLTLEKSLKNDHVIYPTIVKDTNLEGSSFLCPLWK
jgi:Ras-related protein Rab-1A